MTARILVVDDDDMVLDSLVRGLRMEGYAITPASNPTFALELFKKGERFDVVVSDLEMPRMHGDELCRAVQQIAITPFILCSGHLTVHQRAGECGASASFTKPVMPSALKKAIRGLIVKPVTA